MVHSDLAFSYDSSRFEDSIFDAVPLCKGYNDTSFKFHNEIKKSEQLDESKITLDRNLIPKLFLKTKILNFPTL